jgi:hypothetical protein
MLAEFMESINLMENSPGRINHYSIQIPIHMTEENHGSIDSIQVGLNMEYWLDAVCCRELLRRADYRITKHLVIWLALIFGPSIMK